MYIIRRRDKMEALSVDIEREDFMEDRIYRGLRRRNMSRGGLRRTGIG